MNKARQRTFKTPARANREQRLFKELRSLVVKRINFAIKLENEKIRSWLHGENQELNYKGVKANPKMIDFSGWK